MLEESAAIRIASHAEGIPQKEGWTFLLLSRTPDHLHTLLLSSQYPGSTGNIPSQARCSAPGGRCPERVFGAGTEQCSLGAARAKLEA